MNNKIVILAAAIMVMAGAFLVIAEANNSDAAFTYTLSYDANGGSGAPSTQTFTTDESGHVFTVSYTEPTRTNYDFLGWATTSGAVTPTYQGGDSITCTVQLPTVTLYAVWQYNAPTTYTYTLSYDANGGSGAPSSQSQTTTATSYQFTVSATQPTRTNYDFLGWSTSSSASSPSYQGGDSITCTVQLPTVTLYAVWDYNPPQYTCYLYYSANGGSGAPSTQSYTGTSTSNHSFTISNSEPYRSSYEFLGWATSSSASTPSYYGGGTISVPYNGSQTLYAVWEYDAPTSYTYTLTYSANGGSGAPSTQTQTTTATGYTFTVSATQPTRDGYTFLGWATSSSASTPTYQGGDSVTCTTQLPTVNLYAVWGTNYTYTLNYDANGGSGAPSTQTQTTTATGYTFTVSATEPTRTDYNFLGWATSNDAVTPTYQSGDSVTCTSQLPTVTLYAVWSATAYTYTLNYDANGGTGAPASETQTSTQTGYTFTVSATQPTRDNYAFLGWATSNDAAVPTLQAGDSVTCTSQLPTVTIYAVWSPTYTYTLNYDANGGSGAPSTQTQTTTATGYTFIVSPVSPVRDDYTFLGWAGSSGASVPTKYAGDSVTCTSQIPTVTLYAVWGEPPQPTANYWSNDNFNGKISILFKLPSGPMEHSMTMDLMAPTVSNGITVWSDSGYDLTINIIAPSPSITATLSGNAITPVTKTVSLGTWSAFQIDLDISEGKVTATPVKVFNSFTDFTLYENQTKNILDFGSVVQDCSVLVIEHSSSGAYKARFSVVSTDVFLDTYGVILYNPSINLYSYFPQFNAIRANFFSFAIYGESITINGTTYILDGSKITVQYVTDGEHNYLPGVMPNTTVKSRTFDLTNIYVTFDNSTGHVELTFVNEKFTIDLGPFPASQWTVSMQGAWFFTMMVYEPYTATEKTLSDWKMMPELSAAQMILIFMGLLVVCTAAFAIHSGRKGLGFISILIIAAAGIAAYILLG